MHSFIQPATAHKKAQQAQQSMANICHEPNINQQSLT
jgi:hypothetical protein